MTGVPILLCGNDGGEFSERWPPTPTHLDSTKARHDDGRVLGLSPAREVLARTPSTSPSNAVVRFMTPPSLSPRPSCKIHQGRRKLHNTLVLARPREAT